MGDTYDPDLSSATEIHAELRPLAPWWQWIIGLMFFGLGVGSFSVIPDSLWSVTFSVLLLVGIAAVLAYFLRNKAIPVTLRPGDDCVLIRDPTRPDLGKLVPSRVEQEDNRRILVDRRGTKWELKRVELRFASPEDTTRVMSMLRRFVPNP